MPCSLSSARSASCKSNDPRHHALCRACPPRHYASRRRLCPCCRRGRCRVPVCSLAVRLAAGQAMSLHTQSTAAHASLERISRGAQMGASTCSRCRLNEPEQVQVAKGEVCGGGSVVRAASHRMPRSRSSALWLPWQAQSQCVHQPALGGAYCSLWPLALP